MAIIQAMIQKINQGIEDIKRKTDKLDQIAPLNTSKCLICNSDRLVVKNTRKRKKGYTYRICTCLNCGSENKQILSTISAVKNKNIFTLSNRKMNMFYKPMTFIVKNNKVSLKKSIINSKIWNLIFKSQLNTIIKLSENLAQKDYDNGLFQAAKESIDPVKVRVGHKIPTSLNPSIAKMFFKYMGIDMETTNLTHVYVGTMQYKQIDEETDSYYIVFNKIAIIPQKD